ncbi:MAG TPA: GNAT family N-acetyltransferase [Bacteroidia bacterium]|nr:GNAT family N-acetyltransferase [Bacteroidia bacterium]
MKKNDITWQCKPFSDLRAAELHRLLSLRCAVFVVEQNCPYLDPDHKDEHALHVMGWKGSELVACARILPAGISYDEVSVGRVATSSSVRGKGVGRELMKKTMEYIRTVFGDVPVRISAQSYLQIFYEDLGFKRTKKKEYLEDDIPHVEMLLGV